eukprot:324421-Chlamydomonas_euryale.AAC.1
MPTLPSERMPTLPRPPAAACAGAPDPGGDDCSWDVELVEADEVHEAPQSGDGVDQTEHAASEAARSRGDDTSATPDTAETLRCLQDTRRLALALALLALLASAAALHAAAGLLLASAPPTPASWTEPLAGANAGLHASANNASAAADQPVAAAAAAAAAGDAAAALRQLRLEIAHDAGVLVTLRARVSEARRQLRRLRPAAGDAEDGHAAGGGAGQRTAARRDSDAASAAVAAAAAAAAMPPSRRVRQAEHMVATYGPRAGANVTDAGAKLRGGCGDSGGAPAAELSAGRRPASRVRTSRRATATAAGLQRTCPVPGPQPGAGRWRGAPRWAASCAAAVAANTTGADA